MSQLIYVGALWHQYCDPFIGVVGFDKAEVEAKLDALAQEELDRVTDVPDDEMPDVAIMSSGVHAESYDRLEDFVCDQHSLADAQDVLRQSGVWIC
jgi:hypothetical protein